MARTNAKWIRAYVDGYDFSGSSRAVGNLGLALAADDATCLSDGAKNVTVGQVTLTVDPLNAVLSPAALGGGEIGFHEKMQTQATNIYTVVYGVNAEPVAGDLAFCWKMENTAYQLEGTGTVNANVTFGGPTSTVNGGLPYGSPWGRLLHAKGAETAVNTAVGIDDNGGSSALGGIFWYHLFAGNGTVTIKAQDAATNTNPSFSDLTGATSGVISPGTSPTAGFVLLSSTATVRQFLRWQIVLGTATTVTFACGLIRRLW